MPDLENNGLKPTRVGRYFVGIFIAFLTTLIVYGMMFHRLELEEWEQNIIIYAHGYPGGRHQRFCGFRFCGAEPMSSKVLLGFALLLLVILDHDLIVTLAPQGFMIGLFFGGKRGRNDFYQTGRGNEASSGQTYQTGGEKGSRNRFESINEEELSSLRSFFTNWQNSQTATSTTSQGGSESQGATQSQGGSESQGASQSQGGFGTQGASQSQGGFGTQGASQSQGGFGTQGASQSQGGFGTQGASQSQGGFGTQGASQSQGGFGTQGASQSQGGFGTQGASQSQGGFGTQGASQSQGGFGTQGASQSQGGSETQGQSVIGGSRAGFQAGPWGEVLPFVRQRLADSGELAGSREYNDLLDRMVGGRSSEFLKGVIDPIVNRVNQEAAMAGRYNSGAHQGSIVQSLAPILHQEFVRRGQEGVTAGREQRAGRESQVDAIARLAGLGRSGTSFDSGRTDIEKRSGTDYRSEEEKRSGTDYRSAEEKRSGTDYRSEEEKRSGTDYRSEEEKRSGTDYRSEEEKRSGTDYRSEEEKRSGTDYRSEEEKRSGTDYRSEEEKRSGTDYRSEEEKRSGTDYRSAEEKLTATDFRNTQDQRSATDFRNTEQTTDSSSQGGGESGQDSRVQRETTRVIEEFFQSEQWQTIIQNLQRSWADAREGRGSSSELRGGLKL